MWYGIGTALLIAALVGISWREDRQRARREERRLKRKKWRKWWRSKLGRKSVGRSLCRRLIK